MKFLPFLLLFLLYATCVMAQDTLHLNPLTVTAPAWSANATPDARPAATISPAELTERYYGQEPALLLARQPSVTAYTDAGSGYGYAYFRLRGIDQTRLNFTLDGVPLNEPEDQGFYFNNYADLLSSIRAVQVQPGVNVGVNGTAAYGGSVQLLSPGLGGDDYTEISAGTGSFGGYRLSAAGWRTTPQGWSHYGRLTGLGSQGYRNNSEHAARSAFLQTGRTGKKDILKLTFFGGHQANQMAWLGVRDSLLRIDPRTNVNHPDERDAFITTLTKAQYTRSLTDQTTWSTSVYHGFQNGNYDFDLDNFLEADHGFGVYNYAFRYHNVGLLSNLAYASGNWDVRTGIHAQHHNRRHTGSKDDIGELYQNTGRKSDASGFLALASSTKTLHLRAAAQMRHVSFNYSGSVILPAQNHTFLNFELAATKSLGNGKLYYRFGHTGREPTRNDLFAGEDDLLSGGDGPLLGVTDPEFVYDHELGLTGNATAFRYALNLFYLDFKDEITLNGSFGPNGLPLRSSVASSYRTGLEIQLARNLGARWEAALNGTWMRSRIEQDGTVFSPVLSPDLVVQPSLTYRKNKWFAGLDARYQSESYLDLSNEFLLENFTTLDLRAGFESGRWSIVGQLFNLANAAYATNGQLDVFGRATYHRQAGRNFWITLNYRW